MSFSSAVPIRKGLHRPVAVPSVLRHESFIRGDRPGLAKTFLFSEAKTNCAMSVLFIFACLCYSYPVYWIHLQLTLLRMKTAGTGSSVLSTDDLCPGAETFPNRTRLSHSNIYPHEWPCRAAAVC